MKTEKNKGTKGKAAGVQPQDRTLFDRVASILDQARANAVRSINNQMIIAYWLIGREIVQELQRGDERAEYGRKVLDDLSTMLTARYGKGFSVTNLRYFRLFYQTYADRVPEIHHMACDELDSSDGNKQIHHTTCDELEVMSHSIENSECTRGFSPFLSWSHYRTLTKVENKSERLFYELEAEKEGWSVVDLQRQINTFLFARLLKSRDRAGLMELTRKGNSPKTPVDAIKDPYILDFLALPDSPVLHESSIEKAIISNLQSFLLELGKGFAFIGRQKRLQFEDDFFYIDLVFYNCILKCYLLIDLKIGELTHQDIGQMDSYVRMFDDKYITEGDNPTIGLILCSRKNETIVKYSVLNNSKQLFASKYMLYLPTEEELKREIEHHRQLLEERANYD